MRELEVLKDLRREFKKNARFFEKTSPGMTNKYAEYEKAIDMAIYCVSNFPFYMPISDIKAAAKLLKTDDTDTATETPEGVQKRRQKLNKTSYEEEERTKAAIA